MPRFKGDKSKGLADDVLRKGMKLFKKGDKGGKALPDEVLAVLQRLIPALGPSATVGGATLYSAPASLPTRNLAQLRVAHRAWISPRDLGCEMASRKVPPPTLTQTLTLTLTLTVALFPNPSRRPNPKSG